MLCAGRQFRPTDARAQPNQQLVERGHVHREGARQVVPEHAALQRLDVPAHVRLLLEEVSFEELVLAYLGAGEATAGRQLITTGEDS